MGWSCNRQAGFTLNAIQDFCFKQTGMTNVFENKGTRYMFEVGREQSDGSIVAQVYRYISDGRVRKTSSLKIGPDGKIQRGLAILKNIPVRILLINNGTEFPTLWLPEEPTEKELYDQVVIFNKSYESGGANEHVSTSMGYVPYANSARVVDLDGNVLVEWQAGMFQMV